MSYLFSSESVSEGHPDKVADQISDAILDQFLAYDPQAHVACETFVTTGQVVIMGEVHSSEYIDLQTVARKTINRIGYTKAEYQFDGNSCGIMTAIHEQSSDIDRGVSRAVEEEQGAGDQGMMFGYATNETENYMPVSLDLAHLIVRTLADIRKEGRQMTYLRPDSKSQVTVQYSDQGRAGAHRHHRGLDAARRLRAPSRRHARGAAGGRQADARRHTPRRDRGAHAPRQGTDRLRRRCSPSSATT